MTPQTAEFFIALELDAQDRQRLDELAENSRDGVLTKQEELELEEYRRAGRLVEMLKLKAKMLLRASGETSE